MLKTLKIQNFKRFRHLTIPGLKRVNLIAGKNNTGKTGVLEALLLLSLEGVEVFNCLKTAFRNCGNVGDETENYWKWLFFNRNTSGPAIVSAETDEYPNYSVALGFGRLPPG